MSAWTDAAKAAAWKIGKYVLGVIGILILLYLGIRAGLGN